MDDLFDTPPAGSSRSRFLSRRGNPGWSVAFLGMVMALALAVIVFIELYQDRQAARAQAEATATNLSNAIARDIERNINLYSYVLTSLRDTEMSEALRSVPSSLRDTVLFAHTAVPKEMGVLFITDADGTIISESSYNQIRGQSRGWRPYFQYHRLNTDRGMLISGPYSSATTGDPVVVLSMRLDNPDGSFRGVVAASMLLSYFDELFADIYLEPGADLTLYLDNGVVLARKPFEPDVIGRDQRQNPYLLAAAKTPFSIYDEKEKGRADRMVASTAISHWPLRIHLAQPSAVVFHYWQTKAVIIGITAAALTVGIIAMILMAHREGSRLARIQAALAEANVQLERIATTDALTGIANRRVFDEMLQREEARSSRTPHDTAVLMIDIDLFKSFNDTYGHGAGDATLRSVAQAIARSVTRGGDLAARVGGEEFAVLLTDTDEDGAHAVAERIRVMVAALGIRHVGSPHGHVTVSVGVACNSGRHNHLSVGHLLDLADEALYQAKNNGRDRVEISRPAVAA